MLNWLVVEVCVVQCESDIRLRLIQRPLEVGLHSRISPNGKIILPGDLQHFFKLQVTDGNVGGGGIVGRKLCMAVSWMLDPVKFEARL